MRRGVVFVVALLATAGGVMAAYFGARHYGENRIRETMNTVVAGTATVANLQYGAIAFDPLARRASVQDVAVSWQNADLTIGRVVFSDVDFGAFDPEHGRVELHAVTDGGFFNSLVGWIAQCGTLQGFVSRDGPWATVKYNLLIEYDYEANSRSLTIRKLEWSAPEWGDLAVTLDVTHLPEPLRLPDLAKTGSLGGPITVLKALLAQLPDLEPTLIRAATLTYRDHGAINRIIDGMAESVADGDPQVYFLDRRDALKRKIADGKAAAWDQPLLDVLLGKADVDLSVAPQSPVPLARVLRLPQDAAATTGALALKMATAGTRDLGHFAITEKEERALRARPFIEAGDFGLTEPDLPNKFVALSSFQKAVTIAPDDPRAVEGVGHAVAVLIGEARKREEAGAFYGEDGAVPLYQKIIQRVPDSAAAKAAFAAVPQHLAAAALAYAEMTDGAESAYALLRGATSMNAADPAVLAAADRVADRLVEQGDRRADEGAYLDESSRLGALTYYGDALALMPGKASALRALDTAASRLRVDVAQRVSVGDQAVAADTVAAIKRQWPELPGKDDLAAQFVALLTPPRSTAVFVYNWSDYIGEFTNQRFTEKTGISVRYDVFDSNETLEAKLMGGNTGYDVVVPSGVFLGRQIPAGVFRKLDKSKLPNLANLDPALMAASSAFDPDHAYAVPYFWGTVGFGYNIAAIKKRMPDAPVDSWRMVFDPAVVAKFKDCGVTILDSPGDVLSTVLLYLGLDPYSERPEDYAAAQRVLAAVRPYIRYFHSSSYINDLANGEVCLAIGWNGDVAIAQYRADQVKSDRIKLRYVVPKEGTLAWIDNLAIPADAPHPDAALAYIDYLLDAQVAANNANYVHYASPNKAAFDQGLINATDMRDPAIYPPASVMARLVGDKPASPEVDRLRTRTWTAVKAGQ